MNKKVLIRLRGCIFSFYHFLRYNRVLEDYTLDWICYSLETGSFSNFGAVCCLRPLRAYIVRFNLIEQEVYIIMIWGKVFWIKNLQIWRIKVSECTYSYEKDFRSSGNIACINFWFIIQTEFQWSTVKPDLKTTSINRPPVLRDHFQILPRVISIILTCIKRLSVFKNQRPHFLPPILLLRDIFSVTFAFYVKTYFN